MERVFPFGSVGRKPVFLTRCSENQLENALFSQVSDFGTAFQTDDEKELLLLAHFWRQLPENLRAGILSIVQRFASDGQRVPAAVHAPSSSQRHSETASIVPKYFQEKRLLNDIFSTLATKMLLYEPIAGSWESAKERISLTSWSESELILILGNSEIARVAIDNINRCIFKRASDITLMKPERASDRTWFFIDEVSEAGRLTAPAVTA